MLEEVEEKVDVDNVDEVVDERDVLVEVVDVEFSIAVATMMLGAAYENATITNSATGNISTKRDRFPFIQAYLTPDVLLKLILLFFCSP